MSNKPTLAIVIPAYNEEKYIWKCIENILIAKKWWYIDEIIVIDNNSKDNTSDVVRQYGDIKLFLEKKQWTNHARQRWYIESTSDLVAFIDADCQMQANRPEKVVNIFLKNPEIWILTWGYLYHDGNWIHNLYARFTRYIRVPIRKSITWYIWNGGNMTLRRNILDKIWWLDTKLEFYGDDIDTARRASQISKCGYSKDIIIPTSYRRFNWAWFRKTNINYIKASFYDMFSKKKYNPWNEYFR